MFCFGNVHSLISAEDTPERLFHFIVRSDVRNFYYEGTGVFQACACGE